MDRSDSDRTKSRKEKKDKKFNEVIYSPYTGLDLVLEKHM